MSKRSIVFGLALAVSGVTGACTGEPSASTSAEPGASAPRSPASSAAAVAAAKPTAAPTATPTATPSPEPTATPVPKPTPVPWAIYRSKPYRFSIKHPPGWSVTPGTATRADRIDDSASHYVYLESESGSDSVNVRASIDAQKVFMRGHYGAKLVSDEAVKVGALSGRLLVFNGSDDGKTFRIQYLLLSRGKVGYHITMLSNSGAERAGAKLFLRMYSTFRPTS